MQKQALKVMQNGAWLLCLGIVLGAFGKHGLENKVSDHEISIFETAARYQVYNALGLLALGLAHAHFSLKWFKTISRLIYAGVGIFCISLYLLGSAPLWTTADVRMLGAITPLGGLCMISAWAAAALSLGQKIKSLPA